MSYLDSVQKVTVQIDGESVECVAGSFKGVPFFFDSADFSGGGRNVQTNEIPFSDSHVNEDVGKNVESYQFNIYFVGEDAENKKNEFLRVCNEDGAGELVHPHFGVFNARVKGGISLSYNNRLEYISGSVTFVPENDFEIQNTVVSLSGKTKAKAEKLRNAVADYSSKKLDVSGKNRSIVDKAVDLSYKAVDAVYSARKVLQKASEFVKQVGRIKSNIRTALLAPRDFVSRMQNLVTMSEDVLDFDVNPKDNVSNSIGLMQFASGIEVFDGVSSENRDSIETLVRLTAASSVAENLVDCEFTSTSEAEDFHEKISDSFEKMLGLVSDADLYMITVELEAVSLKSLREKISRIPYEVSVDIPETNNLLSIVYGVYGNLDNLDGILSRNGYRDPLFVKPSDRVMVLCDD